MNFRSEVSTVASHWFEAMMWINEIESAKSFFRSEDVKIPSLGHSCRVTSRFLKLKKQAASRNHQRRSLENCLHCVHGKTNVFSRGGHVAWVIYDYFKVSDTDEVFFIRSQRDARGWGPKDMSQTGGLTNVPNLRVCKHLEVRWHRWEKGELT